MKEDILEQLVDEYLMHKGYFTMHNVKFKPRKDHPEFVTKKDSVASDIDVLAIHPMLKGPERIIAVSCKSWQAGFDPGYSMTCIDADKVIGGRTAWLHFRELCSDKWADAFIGSVEAATGSRQFVYWTAVTRLQAPERIGKTILDSASASKTTPSGSSRSPTCLMTCGTSYLRPLLQPNLAA